MQERTLAILLDGTDDVPKSGTAIGRLADAMRGDPSYRVLYEEGLGVHHGERISGTLWGRGFRKKVRRVVLEADRIFNEEQLHHVLVAGFSRGGAEAIAVANLLSRSPYLLGLFDPVAATIPPMPKEWLRQPRCHTFSALALDEKRREFWPVVWLKGTTVWQFGAYSMSQRWFNGEHSDIGGRSSGSALDWFAGKLPPLNIHPPYDHQEAPSNKILPHKNRRSLVGRLEGEILGDAAC